MIRKIKQALRRKSTAESKSSHGSRRKSVSFASPIASFSNSLSLSNSAAETVLKTPELVEMILAHLDLNELLSVQRVCRHWKEILNSSTRLKRKLYLSPITKIDERIPVDNAWMKTRFPDLGVYLLQGNPKWRTKFVRALSASDFDRIGTQFFSEPNASWRDMLLTQPPIKDVVVYATVEEPTRRKRSSSVDSDASVTEEKQTSVTELVEASIVVKSPTGVTMGMIVDAGIEAQRRGFALARKRLSDRKDSGYVSMGSESGIDDIEVAVVEVAA